MVRLLILIAMMFIYGCCPTSEREEPPHYNFEHDYLLVLDSVAKGDSSDLISVSGDCFRTSEIVMCVEVWNGHFEFDIENTAPEPVRILRDAAVYYDETGQTHRVRWHDPKDVSFQNRTASNRQGAISVLPQSSVQPTAFLPDKIYAVRASCFVDYVFQEPIIPGRLSSGRTSVGSEQGMREYVENVHQRRRTVRLTLPIEKGEEVTNCELRFKLRARDDGRMGTVGRTAVDETAGKPSQEGEF